MVVVQQQELLVLQLLMFLAPLLHQHLQMVQQVYVMQVQLLLHLYLGQQQLQQLHMMFISEQEVYPSH